MLPERSNMICTALRRRTDVLSFSTRMFTSNVPIVGSSASATHFAFAIAAGIVQCKIMSPVRPKSLIETWVGVICAVGTVSQIKSFAGSENEIVTVARSGERPVRRGGVMADSSGTPAGVYRSLIIVGNRSEAVVPSMAARSWISRTTEIASPG